MSSSPPESFILRSVVTIYPEARIVVLTTPPFDTQRCLRDLRERFAKIEIQASKPIVPFRETAVKGIGELASISSRSIRDKIS